MDEIMRTLGTEDCKVPEEAVAVTRESLCETFRVKIDEDIGKGVRGDTRSRYFANLWEVLLQEAGDPEEEVPMWLKEGAPVGWRGTLAPNGVFPTVDGDSAAVEKSREFEGANLGSAFLAPPTRAAPTTVPSTTQGITRRQKSRGSSKRASWRSSSRWRSSRRSTARTWSSTSLIKIARPAPLPARAGCALGCLLASHLC